MPSMSREQFLQTFEFCVAQDFQKDGIPATWASGHPKKWAAEDAGVQLPDPSQVDSESVATVKAALSLDESLFAASAGRIIYVYDVESLELRQQLKGNTESVQRLEFLPTITASTLNAGKPTLLSIASHSSGRDPKIIFWELDEYGRLPSERKPLDTTALAHEALDSIRADLVNEHGWTDEDVSRSGMLPAFQAAIVQAETEHFTKDKVVLSGTINTYSNAVFSPDGTLLLYLDQNRTTQSHMRPPDELPRAMGWDLRTRKERFRLSGHTDSIMCATFSPSGADIATVSWDQTMRMWDAATGHLKWVTEPSGGQNWAVKFSPDLEHVALSSKGGKRLTVHKVSNGEQVSAWPEEFSGAVRNFEWHPDGRRIAFAARESAYVWDAFGSAIHLHWKLDVGEPKRWFNFASVSNVFWVDDGKRLVLYVADGTSVVWDCEENRKWRFQRPYGLVVGYSESVLHFLKQRKMFLSADGDRCVRFWKAE